MPHVLSFLNSEAQKAATLFLVGDLFDFWFEWKHAVPGAAFPVLAALHSMVKQGKRIIYLAGNHDGHLGGFLEKRVGLEISRKPISAVIDSKRFYIIHGDGIHPADRGYRILRALVRWKPTEKIFRLVHPDFGIWFAYRLSINSREKWRCQAASNIAEFRKFGESELKKGFDHVVIGHLHESDHFRFGDKSVIAIGDWIGRSSYGVFEDGELSLRYFEDVDSK